jgi:hypothetical protein
VITKGVHVYISHKSHLDHNLTFGILKLLLEKFGENEGFSIQTFDLPEGVTLPSGLYGPAAGDPPVPEDVVTRASRNGRPTLSRMVDRPTRPVTTAVAIMGPDGKGQTVLYTVYGGVPAPREPDDPSLTQATEAERQESRDFWAVHALAIGS